MEVDWRGVMIDGLLPIATHFEVVGSTIQMSQKYVAEKKP